MSDEESNEKSLKESLANPSVDTNRMRIKTLIICTSERNFESASTYLTRRGWKTYLSTSVIEGFKQISIINPDFILLSANIKSNKFQMLPTIIYKTFKIPVVLFGESIDALTLKTLQDVNSNYKMQGIASGPSIHRSIKNILHEMSKSNDTQAIEFMARIAKAQSKKSEQNETKWKKQKKGYTFSTDDDPIDKKESMAKFYEKIGEEERAEAAQNKETHGLDTTSEELAEIAAKYYRDARERSHSVDQMALDSANLNFKKNVLDEEESSPEKFGELDKNKNKIETFEETNKVDDISHLHLEIDALKSFIIEKAEEGIKLCNSIQVYGEKNNSCNLWTYDSNGTIGIILIKVVGTWSQTKEFTTQFEHLVKGHMLENMSEAILSERIDFESYLEIKNKVDGEVFTEVVSGSNFLVEIKYIIALNRSPKIGELPNNDKYKIDARDIVMGLPAGADVFIHLPINNRFIKYINDKTSVTDKHKDILLGADAYISADQVSEYRFGFTRNKAIEKFIEIRLKNKKAS